MGKRASGKRALVSRLFASQALGGAAWWHSCIIPLLQRHVFGAEFWNLLKLGTGVLAGVPPVLEVANGVPFHAGTFM